MLYIKSFDKFEGEYATSTRIPVDLTDNSKLIKQKCQRLIDILASAKCNGDYTASLRPNTTHSQLPTRLSVSGVSKDYQGMYRSEGLVFATKDHPAFCSPVDVMALTDGKTFTSEDYYSKLILHASFFMMENYHNMKLYFPNPQEALQSINRFRTATGLEKLTENEIRPYNECCFFREIKIKPLALIGTSKEMEDIAKKNGLEIYSNPKEFMQENRKKCAKSFEIDF